MYFLFSLINIFFAFFFFLFWRLLEAGVFWILAIVFFLYFSPLISIFSKKEKQEIIQKKSKFSLKDTIFYLKKGSYYLSFSLFYLSLYGIIYGVSLTYGFSDFFSIFQYITFGISCMVIGIFFYFFQKKLPWRETLFLIFRSNVIIFTILYGLLMVAFLFGDKKPDMYFAFNTILSLLWLVTILMFDDFIGYRKKYLYNATLFYLFLYLFFYHTILFPFLDVYKILLYVMSGLSLLYFEFFPRISFIKPFAIISRYVGVGMNYIAFLGLFFALIYHPLDPFYSSLFLFSLLFHYFIHQRFCNYISYSAFLFGILFLVVQFFAPLEALWFFSYCLFVFLVPTLFIGSTYVWATKHPLDIYLLHYTGLLFTIVFIFYYFISVSEPQILSISTVFLFESLLSFASYLRLKK